MALHQIDHVYGNELTAECIGRLARFRPGVRVGADECERHDAEACQV